MDVRLDARVVDGRNFRILLMAWTALSQRSNSLYALHHASDGVGIKVAANQALGHTPNFAHPKKTIEFYFVDTGGEYEKSVGKTKAQKLLNLWERARTLFGERFRLWVRWWVEYNCFFLRPGQWSTHGFCLEIEGR